MPYCCNILHNYLTVHSSAREGLRSIPATAPRVSSITLHNCSPHACWDKSSCGVARIVAIIESTVAIICWTKVAAFQDTVVRLAAHVLCRCVSKPAARGYLGCPGLVVKFCTKA